MTIDLSRLNPPPVRLGQCAKCAYLRTGPAAVCYPCSVRDFTLPPYECKTCDLALNEDGRCGNPLCSWDDRFFEWNYAMVLRQGVIRRITDAFKFENSRAWGIVLGRLLTGFLDEHSEVFREFDVIISSPAYPGEDGEARDHAGEVLRWASDADGARWPFELDPVVIRRTAVTPLKGKTWKARKLITETELRAALHVSKPAKVRGRSVLVYDDIFTDGFTLREVARVLLRAGATRVCGVTLMRQPFTQQS